MCGDGDRGNNDDDNDVDSSDDCKYSNIDCVRIDHYFGNGGFVDNEDDYAGGADDDSFNSHDDDNDDILVGITKLLLIVMLIVAAVVVIIMIIIIIIRSWYYSFPYHCNQSISLDVIQHEITYTASDINSSHFATQV